jgi:hypothetical protein
MVVRRAAPAPIHVRPSDRSVRAGRHRPGRTQPSYECGRRTDVGRGSEYERRMCGTPARLISYRWLTRNLQCAHRSSRFLRCLSASMGAAAAVRFGGRAQYERACAHRSMLHFNGRSIPPSGRRSVKGWPARRPPRPARPRRLGNRCGLAIFEPELGGWRAVVRRGRVLQCPKWTVRRTRVRLPVIPLPPASAAWSGTAAARRSQSRRIDRVRWGSVRFLQGFVGAASRTTKKCPGPTVLHVPASPRHSPSSAPTRFVRLGRPQRAARSW